MLRTITAESITQALETADMLSASERICLYVLFFFFYILECCDDELLSRNSGETAKSSWPI